MARVMTEVNEIQRAVIALSEAQYSQFARWFLEHDWEQWDKQIESDSISGKLDFLASQAADSIRRDTMIDL